MKFVTAELLILSGFLCPFPLDGLFGVEERDCTSLTKGVGSCAEGDPDDVSATVAGTPACHHTSAAINKTPRKRQSQIKDVPDQTAHS